MGRFNVRVVISLFIRLLVAIFSKWRICRNSLNRQRWSASWSHHRCRCLHRQHHSSTTKRDRFGRINNVSNHYHLTHSSMGEFTFDLFFSFLSVSLCSFHFPYIPYCQSEKFSYRELMKSARIRRFRLLCISKAKQKQKKHKKRRLWVAQSEPFFFFFSVVSPYYFKCIAI